MERKALERLAEGRDPLAFVARRRADEAGDELRERVREPGDGTRRAAFQALHDERLRPDEDVEALEEVRLEPLERPVGDLEPDQVRDLVVQPLDDRDRDRVAAPRRELVEVERRWRTSPRGGGEVREERLFVEGEVRRRDDDDRIDAERSGVLRERDGVRGRLGAAVNRNGDAARRGGEEELGRAAALGDGEKKPFAGRSESEHAVQAAVREEPGERLERLFVERFSVVSKRRDGRGKGAFQHRRNLS